MIRIPLSVGGVASIRFAVSPLGELFGLLYLVARGGAGPPYARWGREVREVMAGHDLRLLAALAVPEYVPDLLTPEPRSGEQSLDQELALLRRTPASRVRAELDMIVTGRPRAGLSGRPLPAAVADAVAGGEQELLDRLAGELQLLWDVTLAARWARMRVQLRDEIARASSEAAERGTGAMLHGLHPHMSWDDGALGVRSRYDVEVCWAGSVVLAPSLTTPTVLALADPVEDDREGSSRRDPLVVYPVRGSGPGLASDGRGDLHRPRADRHEPDRHTEALLGATRARLLADLADPRTTTELAGRHHLALSAVSYHLGILHRAGLLERRPRQGAVYYEASSLGRTFAAPTRPMSAPRR